MYGKWTEVWQSRLGSNFLCNTAVALEFMFSFQGVEVSLYFDGCFDAGIT